MEDILLPCQVKPVKTVNGRCPYYPECRGCSYDMSVPRQKCSNCGLLMPPGNPGCSHCSVIRLCTMPAEEVQ